MIIQKDLETRIDLLDAKDIMNPNITEVCMKHLNKKFLGICFKSCLVVKINKIIRHSQRYMSEELNGAAYMDIEFEVDGIIYTKGEIINGCNIVKIESDGRIHAKSQYAGLQIRQDTSLVNIYKEGQIVPFIAKRVKYNPAQSAISVEALPFTPMFPKTKIYIIKNPLDDEGVKKVTKLFGQIQIYKDKINGFDAAAKKALMFFQELIYPFKKTADFKLPTFVKKKLTLENALQLKTGIICNPVELKIQDMEFFISEETKEFESPFEIYEKDLLFVLDKYLINVIRHYHTLIEFVETYPTFAKVQEYKDIWRMFNMLKR
jgi:hypothetical protein